MVISKTLYMYRYSELWLFIVHASIPSGANGVVHLWDLSSAKMVGDLRGHVAAITALGYSTDGTLLVSASQDNTLKFWNPGSVQTRFLTQT